MKIPGLNPSY